MKTKRASTLEAFAIGFVLAASMLSASPIATAQEDQLSAQMIQDRDYPSRSNVDTGRQILSNVPPVAPGYRQFMGFIFAVLSGEAEIVPLMPPVPEDVSAHTDLTYATVGDNELKLDIYSPKLSVKPAPLVVLVHGGCWMDGTREEMGFYAVNLASRGYVTASVDYRLSEEAPYPAAVDDLRSSALEWLTTNATTYDIDPSRIALMGASAGGHLVEYLGYAANEPNWGGRICA